MGRATKYNPDLVRVICDAIAVHGTEDAGIRAANISNYTFYKWKTEKPEFSNAVASAREEFVKTRPDWQLRKAQGAIARYLDGSSIEYWDVYKDTIAPDGSVVVLHESKQIKRDVPPWVIERVLGPKIHELDALRTLVEAGWLPRWVIQVAITELDTIKHTLREVFRGILPDGNAKRVKPGLSAEAADAIRREILGIESEDSPSLPAEVVERPGSNQGVREKSADRSVVG